MLEYLDSVLFGFGFLFLVFWPFLLMMLAAYLVGFVIDLVMKCRGVPNRKFWRVLSVWFLALILILMFGCGKTTLAPDGVYRGNIWLYEIDQTAADSKATLGEFINWARANYPALHAQHRDDVLETAESIRNNAPGWFHAAAAARTAYTNALYTGASPAALNDASNALFTLTGVIQSHARTASPLTNSLAP